MDNQLTSDQPRSIKTGDVILTATKSDTSPLSASYKLSPKQSEFFKTQIGIEDDEALKKHIMEVQERAYKVGLS
ncbi:hypothetical protein J3R82DRAFT_4868 [Butyriboletus roseoflavus]|nr:hypothetical protein J3R82DRAFT_4868 [Butyriboletus roseoflavus]